MRLSEYIFVHLFSYEELDYQKLFISVFTPSLWVAIHFIEMFAICYYCHVTVNEVRVIEFYAKNRLNSLMI